MMDEAVDNDSPIHHRRQKKFRFNLTLKVWGMCFICVAGGSPEMRERDRPSAISTTFFGVCEAECAVAVARPLPPPVATGVAHSIRDVPTLRTGCRLSELRQRTLRVVMMRVAGLLVVLASVLSAVSAARRISYMDHLQILDSLLRGDSYDRRATPTNHLNNATWVYCELYIRSFGSISPVTMDFEVDLYLRQKWQDERLRHANITEALDLNDPNLVKAIWKPEVYFPNAKHAEFQYVTVPNVLVRINPDGEILYMLRLKLTFSCMMDLAKFPLDTQVCTMEVASFSKTTEELRLEWKSMNPVIMGKGLKMPQFEIVDINATDCEESFQIGNYSCLVVEFSLSRSVGFHLVQSYLPTILIVVISWVSFWMDVDSVPGRTTLGVTTLLAVSSQSSGIQSGLPRVSYVKAIDVWMGTCTAFVFCALLEFTIVNYMWRKQPMTLFRRPAGSNANSQDTQTKPVDNDNGVHGGEEVMQNRIKARGVDEMSRLFFPLAFGIFNVVYWTYYLTW